MSSKFAEEHNYKQEEKQPRGDEGDEGYRAFMADFMRRAYELQRCSASPARAGQASPARQRSPPTRGTQDPLAPPPPTRGPVDKIPGPRSSPRGACLPTHHQAPLGEGSPHPSRPRLPPPVKEAQPPASPQKSRPKI
ncbi:hypothetical protein PENNAL_c0001G02108 [Penicillium nalgiovense]|uniref:Uncharacterized protein n=1 Tax=Penicillium nalgiovense TaxID=60175 RepID=A0A1V6ZB46_PENNA|nr:hypothetical protein PENNAL_c0001G02108 [Penicillium nalgiovense]